MQAAVPLGAGTPDASHVREPAQEILILIPQSCVLNIKKLPAKPGAESIMLGLSVFSPSFQWHR